MADRKISDLTALTAQASGDLIPIVDVSEAAAADKNKSITVEELFQGIPVSVGVGVASPAVELHVGGSGQQDILIGSTDAGGARLALDGDSNGDGSGADFAEIVHSTGGHLEIRARNPADDATMRFEVDAGEAMRIDSSGRLLVGTTSEIVSSTANSSVHLVDGGGGKIYMMRDDSGSTVAGNDLGMLRFYSNDGGAQESARIEAEADLDHGTDDKPGRLVFSTTADGESSPTERMRIDSSGNVGINQTPTRELSLHSPNNNNSYIHFTNDDTGETSSDGALVGIDGNEDLNINNQESSKNIIFRNNGERMRIDSSGRLLVGTSSSIAFNGVAARLQVQGDDAGSSRISIRRTSNDANGGALVFGKTRSSGHAVLSSGDYIGQIQFYGADGTDTNQQAATISCNVDGTPGTNDMPGRIVFATTADGSASPSERMSIRNNGNVLMGKTGAGISTAGHEFFAYGTVYHTTTTQTPMYINRHSNDGDLISFRQANTTEGTISVSGSTVSYNGAHLSRWSQLPSGAERVEILRGSVLSNIDEMCEWGEEDNEQLNRMQVSDVEGDKNVSGVFQAWDDDDDTYTNDFYCAMTGDFVIRIGAGVTVERGDLLMSAGDGTAKPQDDDIIRSKTIAKVTSTNVSCTYDDGSYCVPCVLMAC